MQYTDKKPDDLLPSPTRAKALPPFKEADREALRLLLHAASHDLKAPLRQFETLLGWTAEEVDAGDTEKVHEHLRLMQERAAKMRRLVDDLLAYVRADAAAGKVETVAPGDLVAAVMEKLDAPGFVFDVAPDMPTITTRPSSLKAVFGHLLANAVLHHDAPPGRVAVRAARGGAGLLFRVEDDGPGIPAHLRKAAFAPLRTLRPRAPGSGVGLALARKLVALQGGRIWIENATSGRGTAVRFYWPEGSLMGKKVRDASASEPALQEAATLFSPNRPADETIGASSVLRSFATIEQFLVLSDRFDGIGHWYLALEEQKVFWSKEVFRIHGRPVEIGEPDLASAIACYHPDDRAMVEQAVEDALTGGEGFEFEAGLVREDGELRRVFSRGRAERAHGAAVGLFGIFIDVTERYRLQQRVQEQEEILRLFVQHVPAAVAMFDAQFRYLAYSRRWIEDYGFHPDTDLTGLSYENVLPPIPEHWKALHQRTLAGETLHGEEDGYVREDETIYVDWGLYPWRRPDESIGGILMHTQNVTDRVLARQKIEETTRWLGLALDAAGAMTWSMDLDDRTFTASPALKSFVGVDPEAPLPLEAFTGQVHPDDLHCTSMETIDKGLEDRQQTTYRVRAHNGDYRHVRCSRALVRDDTDRPDKLFGIIIDIEDLKRVNQDLEEFAYVASHDLKSPLRAVSTLVGWIEEDLSPEMTGAVRENFGKLRQRVRRMESLLDDLLAFSRAGREEFPYTDERLHDLALDVVGLLAIPPAFRVAIEGDRPVVHVQRPPLEAVLRNLIGNAIKHHDRDDGTIRITLATLRDAVEIVVEDDGPGIPAAYRDKVFGMFKTLKPRDKVEGSGVGLALVRRHVEAAGGTVTLNDRADGGRGLAVIVRWPNLPPTQARETR